MEIMEKTDWVFRDYETGEIHPVVINPEDTSNLKKGIWYVIGNYVYECIGKINSLSDVREGVICEFNGSMSIEDYITPELQRRFSSDNVITKEDYDNEMSCTNDYDEILEEYINSYESGENLMITMANNTTSSGEIFMPELRPDDDPFEKVIKSMLRYLKIVLNDYKQNVEKAHILDNLRSALSGATKNMSVTKFLLWCKVLGLDWEIRLSNADDNVPNPLKEDIWVSNKKNTWVDIEPSEDKGIFVVPLKEKDDPLKRLIKLALDQKRINTKDCEDKSSSAHLINNMKSALKSDQKATMLYFMSWCELLDLIFEIKVTDPKSGVYFQTVGFDLYSNVDTSDLSEKKEEGDS